MSKSLVPKKDAGSGVVDEAVNTGVVAGVTIATVVAYSVIPVVGWVAPIVGGGYLLIRAFKRGVSRSKA